MQHLTAGSFLQGGKYKIEKVLGQGGFGITYLATQDLLDRKVCIKEFFFKEYCERDEATSHVSLGTQSNHEIVERFMNKFLKEARTISTLNHPHIIRIYDIFKENNTAYYVMEYIEGMSLAEMVKQQGALSEDVAVGYIKQVASALEFVHQHSINHLDVKPANIMVRKEDNQAVLIDFGLSKQYDASGEQTSTTPVGISHGYAPMEQYKQGGVSTFSPQIDIYALGATLYKLVTGNTPPQAMDILDEGLPALPASVSPFVTNAIKKAMQPRKVDRPKNVDEFLNELKVSSTISPFIQEDKKEKRYQVVDEETKVLNNSNTQTEEKKLQVVDTSQPSASFVEKEKKKNNAAIIGFPIFLVLGCIVLFFLLKGCNEGDTSEDVHTPNSINDYAYVDLGLSVKWADRNVGASSPSDYGSYFAWGETDTKSEYSEFNSVTPDKVYSDIAGNKQYDAVRANWGGNWRLPTKTEYQELVDKCKWTWTTQGGHNGYKVTGPNGNSIFLPATGERYGSGLYDVGSRGQYWSATPGDIGDGAYYLYFDSNKYDCLYSNDRFTGHSMRPVLE